MLDIVYYNVLHCNYQQLSYSCQQTRHPPCECTTPLPNDQGFLIFTTY